MPDLCGIYRIYNIINQKSYVGQSQNIYKRWKQHRADLATNSSKNTHLQRSWNKYGEHNFKFEVLEECEEWALNEKEIFWIAKLDSFRNGYNQNEGGGGNRGYLWSEDSRARASASAKIRFNSLEARILNSQRVKEWHKNHDNPHNKAVVCLNTGARFKNSVEAWASFGNDGRNNIMRCCHHELLTCGKHDGEPLIWMFAEEYDAMSPLDVEDYKEYVLSGTAKRDKMFKRAVVCLNTLEVFNATVDAARKYNLNSNNIRGCCLLNHSYCGVDSNGKPLVWRFFADYQNMTHEDINSILETTKTLAETTGQRSCKSVQCITTGEIFKSIKSAGAAYNINPGNISACLNGRAKSSGKHPITGEKLCWQFV